MRGYLGEEKREHAALLKTLEALGASAAGTVSPFSFSSSYSFSRVCMEQRQSFYIVFCILFLGALCGRRAATLFRVRVGAAQVVMRSLFERSLSLGQCEIPTSSFFSFFLSLKGLYELDIACRYSGLKGTRGGGGLEKSCYVPCERAFFLSRAAACLILSS